MGKGGGREGMRICVWMCWTVQWLISSLYVALSLITFIKLANSAPLVLHDRNELYKNKLWRAPMAACLLGSLLVIGFDLLSCVILIKKSINRAGPGFGYGFLVAYCFTLSCFLLLCGLVLDGFKVYVRDTLEVQAATQWTKYTTQTYIGAEVFALLTFCFFFLFGIALVVLQAGISEQMGLQEKAKTARYAALDVPAVAGGAGALGAAASAGVPMEAAGQFGPTGFGAPTQAFGGPAQVYSDQQQYGYQAPPDYQQLSSSPYVATTEYQTHEYGAEQGQEAAPAVSGMGGYAMAGYGYGAIGGMRQSAYQPAPEQESDTAGLLGGARVGAQTYSSSWQPGPGQI